MFGSLARDRAPRRGRTRRDAGMPALAHLLLLLLPASSGGSLQIRKTQLTEAEADRFGARCLDGSAYAFYASGEVSSARDWVVYLEGGGECDTAKDCRQRASSGGDMGTSVGLPDWISQAGVSDGVTNSDAKMNPHFSTFGTVYLPYCSGDDWLGAMRVKCDPWRRNCTDPNTTAAERSGDWGLHFSGHHNLVAVMNRTMFASAAQGTLRSILLTGGSAGGQGAYVHTDWLADALRERGSNVRVLSNPQYGVFQPTTTYQDWRHGKLTPPSTPYPSSANPTGVPPWLANVNVFVPPRCVAALTTEQKAGPFGELLCGLTPRIAVTVEAPLFLSLNLFDAWLTGVEEGCCGPFGGAARVGPTRSADPHVDYLMSVTAPMVRATVHNATDTNLVQPSAVLRNGAFVPPCIAHAMQWHEASAPTIGGCDHASAVASWFFGHVNSGRDWDGAKVPSCGRVLISTADTVKELAALECNNGAIKTAT
eukprot:3902563-Prymnesium_polylepis.4